MLKSPRQMTTSERKARWPDFSDHELACQCCGAFSPSNAFTLLMDDAQAFRLESGKPLPINSGYRCTQHTIEKKKAQPGSHSYAACDFGVTGEDALRLLQFFLNRGYVGIGINQKGDKRYIHIDRRTTPALWSY
ncbi:D-Ala-D-Ala carboxypeptidase family metallohydrolase [Alteromonas sp. A079]|uniref:D-Ala-D-Ala carboxypeptidase family metallohydrolase n=1 Tax=Alteromonas sp. A079 TaxID=3410268 RepID=UPI003B9E36FC